MIGKTISHYKILEKLGEGGMGVVYKAEDTKLKRTVALKFLPREYSSDIAAKERFVHEAQAASALDHPNICTIYEIGETDDDQSYIAMACYDGQSLKSKIDSDELTIEKSIDIIIQISKGLKRAHEAGIVHRDIKPANIIITEHDEVKILDFGLAKLAGQTRLTKEGMTVGTIVYMSPEQAHGNEVDHRSDIWSLGVILYEMLSGQLPFKGDYEQAIIYSLINEEPVQVSALNEDISQELENIVQKCLAKNPDQRYQSIEELLIDFKPFSSEAAVSIDESIAGILKRLWRKKIVRRTSVIVSSLLILAIIYLLFWPKILEPTPIAVISFENLTGDSAYDNLQKVIPNLLITDLEQSKFFHVNTWERMKDLLEQSGREELDYIDVNIGIQLCKMDNIPAIVTGSIAKIGDMFSIDVKILDTETKEILKSAKSVGKGENSILEHQVDELVKQIATVINLPEKEFTDTKKPIIDVTTTSIEAYKHYILGIEKFNAYYWKEAIDQFLKAVSLDSTFAVAHVLLWRAYQEEGLVEEAEIRLQLAKKYRDKLTHKQQIIFDTWYNWDQGNDVSKNISILKEALSLYPKDKLIFTNLAGDYAYKGEIDSAIYFEHKALDLDPNNEDILNHLGYEYAQKNNYIKALEYLQRYIDLAPNEANPYDSMGEIYLRMNEYKKSIEMYQKAVTIKPDFRSSHMGIASNFIKMREYQNARDHLNQLYKVTSRYNTQFDIHNYLATTYMAEGDTENVLIELENAGNLAEQNSDTFFLVVNDFTISDILIENDKLKEAEEKLAVGKELMEISDLATNTYLRFKYIDISTRLALRKGNINQAKEYADMYKKRAEKVGNVNPLKWWFTLSGLVAYAAGEYEKAITEFKQSDLNIPLNNYHLALVYIKIGNEREAIEELENAVNYSGLPSLKNEMVRGLAEKELTRLKIKNNYLELGIK